MSYQKDRKSLLIDLKDKIKKMKKCKVAELELFSIERYGMNCKSLLKILHNSGFCFIEENNVEYLGEE